MKKSLYGLLAVGLSVGALLFFTIGGEEDHDSHADAGKTVHAGQPADMGITDFSNMPAAGAAPHGNVRLVIGRISTNASKHWPRLETMAEYLATEMAGQGVAGVDVRLVATIEEMEALFRTGQIDLISETAFGAIELANSGVAEMMMREWKGGVSAYNSVIFARRDGGIRSLSDLVGRAVAFEDSGSTSAYLMPRAAMEAAGLRMIELPDPTANPPSGAVGFTFGGEEDTVVGRVHRNYAAAGAVSNLDWNDDDEVDPGQRADLIVIHETSPVIRSVLLVRSNLDPALKARLAGVFENMHQTPTGRATLEGYFKVERYDRIEGAALDGLLSARAIFESAANF